MKKEITQEELLNNESRDALILFSCVISIVFLTYSFSFFISFFSQ